MNVFETISSKRAVREFKPDPLPPQIIQQILNAGRRAQSSKNRQPWNFIVIEDKATLAELSKLGDFAGHIAGAAVAIGIVTSDPFAHYSPFFDSGQSAAYMQLAAWELGVGSCMATIHNMDGARQLLGYPQDMFMQFAISFGYPAETVVLERPPRKAGRRTFDDVVHWEKW